jgi:LEA14-like dessication related protein
MNHEETGTMLKLEGKQLLRRSAIVLLLVMLSACGERGVRGEAPFVQVTQWNIEGQDLTATLRVRNVNSEELQLDQLELQVSLGEIRLLDYTAPLTETVAANGFETVDISARASEAGATELARLQAGEIKSLPVLLEGSVNDVKHGRLRFLREGHIYTVPGKPGQFR